MSRGLVITLAVLAAVGAAGEPAPKPPRTPTRRTAAIEVKSVKVRVAPAMSVVSLEGPPVAPVEAEAHAEAPVLKDSVGEGRISVKVAHHFPVVDAVNRVGYLLEFWEKAYGITASWDGQRVRLKGSVYGIDLDAVFTVSDTEILAEARDPGWFWRSKAERYVERLLKKYMHPEYLEVD